MPPSKPPLNPWGARNNWLSDQFHPQPPTTWSSSSAVNSRISLGAIEASLASPILIMMILSGRRQQPDQNGDDRDYDKTAGHFVHLIVIQHAHVRAELGLIMNRVAHSCLLRWGNHDGLPSMEESMSDGLSSRCSPGNMIAPQPGGHRISASREPAPAFNSRHS